MRRVGVLRVSAMTQTPASGPRAPVTTPPMSSLSIATDPPACCARSEVRDIESPSTQQSKTIRRVVFIASLLLPGSVLPVSLAVKEIWNYYRERYAAQVDHCRRRGVRRHVRGGGVRAADLQRLLQLHTTAVSHCQQLQRRVQHVP